MQFSNVAYVSDILMKGRLTALHHAAKAEKMAMVALLLEMGADKSLTTFEEKKAQDLAVEKVMKILWLQSISCF